MRVILTDAAGRPIERPQRDNYDDPIAFMRALWAYNDRVADTANRAFAERFRREVSC